VKISKKQKANLLLLNGHLSVSVLLFYSLNIYFHYLIQIIQVITNYYYFGCFKKKSSRKIFSKIKAPFVIVLGSRALTIKSFNHLKGSLEHLENK
jgi:hypothetical protein